MAKFAAAVGIQFLTWKLPYAKGVAIKKKKKKDVQHNDLTYVHHGMITARNLI